MCVRRKRAKEFFAGPSPVAVGRRLGRVGPLSDKQNIPGKIAMRECRGILGNPACGAAVAFENDSGKRGDHSIGVFDNCGDRIV